MNVSSPIAGTIVSVQVLPSQCSIRPEPAATNTSFAATATTAFSGCVAPVATSDHAAPDQCQSFGTGDACSTTQISLPPAPDTPSVEPPESAKLSHVEPFQWSAPNWPNAHTPPGPLP